MIEFVLEFLNKKIEWLGLKSREANPDKLKYLEGNIENIISKYSNISKTGRNEYFSFDVNRENFNDDNADYIRRFLLDYGVIEDIDCRVFRRLFENKILTRPIVWIAKESILHYFIKTLADKDKKVIIDHNNVWKITAAWFVIKDENGIIRKIDHK